mgnify:CR=1 FL=1
MTKRERVLEVARYLEEVFPPPYPVTVKVMKLPLLKQRHRTFAECRFSDRHFTIRIESRWPTSILLDSLWHEWAHVRSHPFAKLWSDRPEHSPEWSVSYGSIYSHMVDGGGLEKSRGC